MDLNKRQMELVADKHVRKQVKRLMKPLRLLVGTRDCPTLEEVLMDVALGICALENNPDAQQTYGRIQVQRGPMDGYSLHLRAADIYFLHMKDRGGETGPYAKRQEAKA